MWVMYIYTVIVIVCIVIWGFSVCTYNWQFWNNS